MFFQWPDYLWLMLLSLVLPLAYVWLLRRRNRVAVRFSSLSVVQAAVQGRQWRRHVPPALMWMACTVLLLAASRPVASIPLPWARSTIMLAMDVSLSMRVSDVKPTRLVAAQEAAKLFLRDLPRHIEVGLVTFAGTAEVSQAATLDRPSLVAAIDGFQMQRGTAIGNAIAISVAELFPDHHIDLSDMAYGGKPRGRSLDDKTHGKPEPKQIVPVTPGSYPSAAIILLTDGRRTMGMDTLAAAKLAADRGVRIHVVGLGTPGGANASTGEGMAIYMQLDEPTLRAVAQMTGGDYHQADTSEKLRSVYETLGSQMQVVKRETELAAPLALLAALLALAAAGLSVLWFGRIT